MGTAGAQGTPLPTPSASPAVSAEEAQRALDRQRAALAQEANRLEDARGTAAARLQSYQQAQRAADQAGRVAKQEALRLQEARRQTAQAHTQLQDYAGSLYRIGMVDARLFLLASAVTAPDAHQFLGDLRLVQYVGTSQSNALTNLALAQQTQVAATRRSQAAAQAQQRATVASAAAKDAADRVVADVVQRMALRRQAVALTRAALSDAEQREAMLARAEAIARLRSQPPEAAVQGALAQRPAATCKGGDLTGYRNGFLPPALLCRLWGTYGQLLRADAAAAFDALSHEYALEFGQPICVTDSYRTYQEQEVLAVAKPDLAASPGQSNHGWGIATDLCDGIERFSTPEHRWMLDNSMRFGWFHPDWAEPTGSRPEPWHWEFAG